jgi:hypothetical protein
MTKDQIIGLVLILLVLGPTVTFFLSRKQRERSETVRELFHFLTKRKRYWLLPLALVLVCILAFIVVTAGGGLWAYVYVGIFGA